MTIQKVINVSTTMANSSIEVWRGLSRIRRKFQCEIKFNIEKTNLISMKNWQWIQNIGIVMLKKYRENRWPSLLRSEHQDPWGHVCLKLPELLIYQHPAKCTNQSQILEVVILMNKIENKNLTLFKMCSGFNYCEWMCFKTNE